MGEKCSLHLHRTPLIHYRSFRLLYFMEWHKPSLPPSYIFSSSQRQQSLTRTLRDCHQMLILPKLGIAAAAGVASHVCLFRQGEWHMQAPVLLRIALALSLCTFCAQVRYDTGFNSASLTASLSIILSYTTALFGSILLYRRFFHRLRNFPGPTWAGLTKFWHVFHCLDSQNYLLLEDLHQNYGQFVRTGANRLRLPVQRNRLTQLSPGETYQVPMRLLFSILRFLLRWTAQVQAALKPCGMTFSCPRSP